MGTSVRERSDNPLSVFADKIPHGDGNRAHTMVRSPSVRTPQASARAATILSLLLPRARPAATAPSATV